MTDHVADHSTIARRWFARPWARRAFVAVCLVVVIVQAFVIIQRREKHLGDYDVSREMGRRFLAGEYLYAGGLHYPYTPTAALSFAPLALVRPGVGLALRYAVAIAGLWLTLRMLRTLVGHRRRLDSGTVFAIEAITLVLAAQYIIRDLDDGGPHLLLLAMLVAGIYCVSRGRDGLGATWFGLADGAEGAGRTDVCRSSCGSGSGSWQPWRWRPPCCGLLRPWRGWDLRAGGATRRSGPALRSSRSWEIPGPGSARASSGCRTRASSWR